MVYTIMVAVRSATYKAASMWVLGLCPHSGSCHAAAQSELGNGCNCASFLARELVWCRQCAPAQYLSWARHLAESCAVAPVPLLHSSAYLAWQPLHACSWALVQAMKQRSQQNGVAHVRWERLPSCQLVAVASGTAEAASNAETSVTQLVQAFTIRAQVTAHWWRQEQCLGRRTVRP